MPLDQYAANQVTEVYIGTFNFNAGTSGSVTMTNEGPDGVFGFFHWLPLKRAAAG